MQGAGVILGVWATHHLLPMSRLERLTVPPERAPQVLRLLAGLPGIRETLLLSTCNRVEAYVCLEPTAAPRAVASAVVEVLAGPAGPDVDQVRDLFVVGSEPDAVDHLFSLACGLDSMVVGEYQIVAQIRDALHAAEREGTVGSLLGALVRAAIRTSRRARTRTGIGSTGASVVSVGLRWAAESIGGLQNSSVLVVGAGRTGKLAGTLLKEAGVATLSVVGRTRSRTEHLAGLLAATAVELPALGDALADTDLVVSATGSLGYVITPDHVAAAAPDRRERPLFVLDLAVPRDVDPRVADLPGVTLVGVDDIGRRLREVVGTDEVAQARQIVSAEVHQFLRRRKETDVVPVIIALRAAATDVVDAEVQRLHDRLPQLDQQARTETQAAMHRVMSKLIHTPTVRVKELAARPGGAAYPEALAALFDLAGEVGEA